MSSGFVPHHLDARPEDLEGNGGRGRYVLLPGSTGRAAAIATRFSDHRVRPHPRGHDLHLGRFEHAGRLVDVAAIATGMGCPSLDIIVNELFALGARRFVRVGTSGSLQPGRVRAGDLVVATAAVRDEHTSRNYVPLEVPALASLEVVLAAREACRALSLDARTHFGPVHCKDSLWARELGAGPMEAANREYMALLEHAGTLASEMESSQLFILAALFDQRLRAGGAGAAHRALAGTVLAVIGEESAFGSADTAARAVDDAIALALETVGRLAAAESGP